MSASPSRLKKYLALLLLCLLAAIGNMPFYRYRDMEIRDPGDGMKAALRPFIPEDDPVLFFPYPSIRESILSAESSLADVRLYPAFRGAPVLLVVPVRRVAAARLADRFPFLCLSADGIVYADRSPSRDLPVVELPEDTPFALGRRLESPFTRNVLDTLAVVRDLPFPKFTRLSLDAQGNWEFFTKEGICVKAGESENLRQRLSVLPPILRVVRARGLAVAYIDIRVEKMPVVKIKK